MVTLSTLALGARAEEPNTGAAFLTGASVFFASMGVGGLLLTAKSGDHSIENAGWLTAESGFTAAPILAHGIVGEWARGLVFAAPPAISVGATATLFGIQPDAIENGKLPKQRILWSFFCVGLFSSAAGVVDAAFADRRVHSVVVAPSVGAGSFGLEVGGLL